MTMEVTVKMNKNRKKNVQQRVLKQITQEDKGKNGNTNNDRDEEKITKVVRKQKAVVDLLQKPREDILRILAQQTEPLMFLTQLPGEIEVRVVHSVTQVTAPLGHPPLRMDGKVVGFFNNPKDGTSPIFIRAPDDIFTEVKAKPPSMKILAGERDWANGNKKELWVQCTDHLDIEV